MAGESRAESIKGALGAQFGDIGAAHDFGGFIDMAYLIGVHDATALDFYSLVCKLIGRIDIAQSRHKAINMYL